MDKIGYLAQDLSDIIKPLAAMIVATIRPTDDDITLYAAKKEYGYAWVNYHLENGNIKFHTKGKRRVASRAQLELLRSAEAQEAHIVNRVSSKSMPALKYEVPK